MLSTSHLNKKVLVAKILEHVAQFPGAQIRITLNSNERYVWSKFKAALTEEEIDASLDQLEQSFQVLSAGGSVSVGISVRPFSGGSSLHIPDFLKKRLWRDRCAKRGQFLWSPMLGSSHVHRREASQSPQGC